MWQFYLDSALLGVGLAMDACAVSMANGMNEPAMKFGKTSLIALTFAVFQALMPLIGWLCVHFVAQQFAAFTQAVPYVALALLAFIGGKMLYEGFSKKQEEQSEVKLTFFALMAQGVATSIDALSVGFTLAEYDLLYACVRAFIIAAVTFGISVGGVYLGKKFGTALGGKASILGGFVLIAIGIKIFVEGVFF